MDGGLKLNVLFCYLSFWSINFYLPTFFNLIHFFVIVNSGEYPWFFILVNRLNIKLGIFGSLSWTCFLRPFKQIDGKWIGIFKISTLISCRIRCFCSGFCAVFCYSLIRWFHLPCYCSWDYVAGYGGRMANFYQEVNPTIAQGFTIIVVASTLQVCCRSVHRCTVFWKEWWYLRWTCCFYSPFWEYRQRDRLCCISWVLGEG